MKERMGKIRSCIQGLKCANFEKLLFELAVRNNLEFKVTDRDKGWLRETIYFEVNGKESGLRKFKTQLENVIMKYNQMGL